MYIALPSLRYSEVPNRRADQSRGAIGNLFSEKIPCPQKTLVNR